MDLTLDQTYYGANTQTLIGANYVATCLGEPGNAQTEIDQDQMEVANNLANRMQDQIEPISRWSITNLLCRTDFQ